MLIGGKSMKVLVTGVNGQLGYDVMNELNQRGHEAILRFINVVMVNINARILEDTLMLKLVQHLPILNCL